MAGKRTLDHVLPVMGQDGSLREHFSQIHPALFQ